MGMLDNMLVDPAASQAGLPKWLSDLLAGARGNPNAAAPFGALAPTVLGQGGVTAAPDAKGVYGSDAVMLPPAAGPGSQSRPPGAPQIGDDALPPNSTPTAGEAPFGMVPQAPPQAAPRAPGMLDRLSAASHNLSASPGLPGIFDAITGAQSGQRLDPRGMAMQGQNATVRALISKGVSPDLAEAARLNPEILKQLLPAFGPKAYQFQTTPDGAIIKIDPTGRENPVPVYQASKPTFGVIGKDSNGNDVHGFVDVTTKKTWDVNGKPTDASKLAGVGQQNFDLTGEDFLKTLDPGRANQIKAIADGRMAPPGGMSLKSPQIQGLMRDVAQYEPGFDLTSWKARNDTRADLAKGKMGQNVTAFNTAIGHLDTLDKAAEALGNSRFPLYNNVANMVANATGDEKVKQFNIAKTAVADELTRAFRGSGGNVHDLIQWENAINSSGSPAQLKATIKQATELLRSRIEAVGDQYSRGMGKTTDPLSLLSPKAQEGIKRLSGEAPKAEAAPSVVAPSTAPAPGRYMFDAASGKLVPQQ